MLWAARLEIGRELPPPFATPSVNNCPQVVSKPATAQLKLPPGFEIQSWATGFAQPRFLLAGNHGEILLADSGERAQSAAAGHEGGRGQDGIVYIFPNGNPAQRKSLIKGLNRPYGLAACCSTRPARTRMSASGPRRTWIQAKIRAAINRYNPDGSGHEIFAAGVRNPIGLHWYPGTDDLWAAVQNAMSLVTTWCPTTLPILNPAHFTAGHTAISAATKIRASLAAAPIS